MEIKEALKEWLMLQYLWMNSEIVVHFFESFASSAKLNIYGVSKGANDHHQAEAVFKAFAKSLKEAIKIEHDEIPSTKGVL